jgi:ATP-dependent helicase/DNAse subunit B
MSISLYLAPAGAGKTATLVNLARVLAKDLRAPRVLVPSRLQARAWRRRLAEAGGALGVRVSTFDDLYRHILHQAGETVTVLTDPVQFRLLRAVLDEAPLSHYASLRRAPGFAGVLRDLIGELKAGGAFPDRLTEAVKTMGGEPRLVELAQLYGAYQERLQQEGWTDYAGTGWLADETLTRHPAIGAEWPCLMVDGFDDLTSVQLSVIRQLADRLERVIITLTGVCDGAARPLVHKRFNRTRQLLEAALGVEALPLPAFPDTARSGPPGGLGVAAPPLAHLERTLFSSAGVRRPPDGAVTMVAAPDREVEVRAALRWLKKRLVRGGMRPGEVALLCRTIEPYRAFISQTADEFGMPIHVVDGQPLRGNPAVAALLDLLRLAVPGAAYLAGRQIVEAWRSPYFDWSETPFGVTLQDAEALDWVARWGSVIGGKDQWEEALARLSAAEGPGKALDEEAPEIPDALPTGAQAKTLRRTFERFVDLITPPSGVHRCRDFVAWLEDLIGDSGEPADEAVPTTGLGVARRALEGPAALAERDLAALNEFKDVLRGLVWAEEAVGCEPSTFEAFLDDLLGAVDAATYRVSPPSDEEAVLVADVTQARGLSFRAVALLGLAEGEFPRTLVEDPFLRDVDRKRLRDEFGLPLDLSTEGSESEYFYEAVTRPRQALLLTRPRIADNGAPWQPSPYWEEVRRLLDASSRRLTSRSRPGPDEAASWPELLQTVAANTHDDGSWAWARDRQPTHCARIERAQEILSQRVRTALDVAGSYDGDLTRWGHVFDEAFGRGRTWSASRLETYQACPFFFFVGRVLGLEPRQPPSEGLDARQLGNIYHRILEELYNTVGLDADASSEPGGSPSREPAAAVLERLQRALPEVAKEVLDAAPRREQFRETAWWRETRKEIVQNVARSLEALETLDERFRFCRAEQSFGIEGQPGPPLEVRDDAGDSFRLRGFIDRVDRAEGDRVRIIDYKTGGPYAYTPRAVREGEKVQLPLYALAAQEALELGEVVDGFYWHVQHAEASSFALARFGPQAAMATAVQHAWEAVRGARRGHFVPEPPDSGCPGYCPAAGFCWRYSASGWG